MSERNCLLHGALEVEWYTDDVPDNDDGTPNCHVCNLEAKIKRLSSRGIEDMKHTIKTQAALLRNLASSACDHCSPMSKRDCETCWAKNYKDKP